MTNASEIYGRIKEGVHIAGYSLERAFTEIEGLLVGDTWKQIGGGFEDVNEFMRSIDLGNFRALTDQRKKIVARVKELQPTASNRAIADMLGTGRRTIDRDTGPNDPPKEEKTKENQQRNGPNGPLSGPEAARAVHKAEHGAEESKARRQEKHEAIAAAAVANTVVDIGGPFPLIYADPPWKWGHFGEKDQENEAGKGRTPDQHYPTLTYDEIKAFAINGRPMREVGTGRVDDAPRRASCDCRSAEKCWRKRGNHRRGHQGGWG